MLGNRLAIQDVVVFFSLHVCLVFGRASLWFTLFILHLKYIHLKHYIFYLLGGL